MIPKHLLNDNITLFHYAGEVDKVAQYSIYFISKVRAEEDHGIRFAVDGIYKSDTTIIFIDAVNSTAVDSADKAVTYLTYKQWARLTPTEQADHWTLQDIGKDYIATEDLSGFAGLSIKNLPVACELMAVETIIELSADASTYHHLEIEVK